MVNKSLLEKLSKLGFSLFEIEEELDANAVLVEVVQSKDLRLWNGFPVVLANSAEKGLFNYDTVKRRLKKSPDKLRLDLLLTMSLALYRTLNIKFSWADKFYENLNSKNKKEFNNLSKKLRRDEDFELAGRVMSSQRLKLTFNNYFNQAHSELKDLLSMKEELGLEYSLSQIFSPKQKELFLKKLKGEKLTKTEKEYFSRVVKKKVMALANPELHRLSRKLLT
ncbi:MAG: hypothetical protein KKD11_04555 [Candidatus Omnitrophica bacterium]|nr:hypothetical protein [Candidatus Omnitrophota bacterium]